MAQFNINKTTFTILYIYFANRIQIFEKLGNYKNFNVIFAGKMETILNGKI